MTDLFPIFLILSPIPICAIIYKYLSSQKDSLQGTVFSTIKFKIAGCIATYIPVLIIVLFTSDPSIFNFNLSNEIKSWNFELLKPYSGSREDIVHGTINFTNGPRNVYFVDGKTKAKNNGIEPFLPGGIAILGKADIYFTLPISDKDRNLVAYGINKPDNSTLILRVVETSDKTTAEPKQYSGQIKMMISRPWERLLIITIVPLIAALSFAKIGPILFNVTSNKNSKNIIIGRILKIFQFNISGATAVYVFISGLLIWIYNDGIPTRLNSEDKNTLNTCESLPKDSVFRLYHAYDFDAPEVAEFAGKLSIDCGSIDDSITISGSANSLIDNELANDNYKNVDDISCYTAISPGRKGFSWSSRLGGIVDGKLILFFQTKELGDSNADNGKIESNIADFKSNFSDYKVKWFFQDFGSGYGSSIYSVNRGELYLEPENSKTLDKCSTLYRDLNNLLSDN